MITNILLATIRVLWRRDDTMELWGIPYNMRPEQSPRDLYMGRRIPDTLALARGYYGATIKAPGVREDWIYLGAPGWWGHLSDIEQQTIQAFLAPLRAAGVVPEGPCEWAPIKNPLSRLRCASMKSSECAEPISRIDRKGYVYCGACGAHRKASGMACRALRAGEIARLGRGETVARY
jgi:hypothetical protein